MESSNTAVSGLAIPLNTASLKYFTIKNVHKSLDNSDILVFLFELYFNCMQNVHISFEYWPLEHEGDPDYYY